MQMVMQKERAGTHAGSKQWSKLWDARTLDPNSLIVEVEHVKDMNDRQLTKMYDLFNENGVVIVQHAPAGNPTDELVSLGKFFGNPTHHDRADERGVVVVAELDGYGEFVGASSGPHLMHTGCTFLAWKDVPKVVLLQCEVQSRIGGRSMLASGAAAYRHFLKTDSKALGFLRDPQVFSISRSAAGKGKFGGTGVEGKAVFDDTRLDDGRVWLTFRFDGEVKLDIRPDAAVQKFDELLNFFNRSENQIDFRLAPNQILICDNTSVVHARTAYQAGSGRRMNRLTLDGTRDGLVFGFPIPE